MSRHSRRTFLKQSALGLAAGAAALAGASGAAAADGKFLFVYLPRGGNVTIDMAKLSGGNATAYWFNPRNGDAIKIGKFTCSGTREFSPPSRGVDNDWVLVLDDAAQNFPIPGAPR